MTTRPARPLFILSALGLLALLSACAGTDGGRRIPAEFTCEDGSKLHLVFDHERDAVVLRLPKDQRPGDQRPVLPSQHPASGMWYAGEGYELRGAGDAMTYAAPGRPQTRCVQRR